ncbi:MAG: 4Fe-4S binding protein [Synergistaceae bacterium]|jgi:polyferredoxin|nr:4Fe-4S binding protein [Synergistaceae bacterium]
MVSRKIIQWIAALGCNAYVPGFLKGRIYRGALKSVCVPGLNCYSCPGAVASCPLGALQAVIGESRYSFSYYAVGLMVAFGLLLGRAICGFLCPFGLVQELLHKVPLFKARPVSSARGARLALLAKRARLVKYVLLAVFVLSLPLFTKGEFGAGAPAFCKYICPAGTITAGGPLLAANPPMREALGWLFALKAFIALATILGCITIYRFFCKFLCPLGAFYGPFNKIALYQVRLDHEKCSHCGVCARVCQMGVDPSLDCGNAECVRCKDCVKACPTSALSAGFRYEPHGKNSPLTKTP